MSNISNRYEYLHYGKMAAVSVKAPEYGKLHPLNYTGIP